MIIELNKIKNMFFLPKQRAANFQIYSKLSECCALTHTRSVLFMKSWNWKTVRIALEKESLWCWYKVRCLSEKLRQKYNVVITLDFGRSNDVEKTTLWQSCCVMTTSCTSWVLPAIFLDRYIFYKKAQEYVRNLIQVC